MQRKKYLISRKKHKIYGPGTDPIEALLMEWDGLQSGAESAISFLPETIDISHEIKKILNETLSEENIKFMEFEQKWPAIAGTELSQRLKPVAIKDEKVMLMADNSITLMEYSAFSKKKLLLDKILKEMGKNFCKNIVIVPQG